MPQAHHVWWHRHLVDDENRPGDLRRPATTALQHDDRTLFDQLATPHTGHLTALEGAAEARSRRPHFEQIALARAMSKSSSEKNRWLSVPLPSEQRA